MDGDDLVFYLGYDKLVEYETKAPRENVALGKATRLTLGEELIHAVHLKKFKEEWVAANRPGDLQHYVAARQREAFADMRKTIEGASGKDREVMLRTIKQSYDVYFRNFKEKITANPSEKDILAFIQNKGHSPTFMNEFMRQIVQLKEQGNITEGVRRFIDEAVAWVKEWLNGLHKGLPGAFQGDFGPELKAQVEQIRKGLDQIDRRVFRERPMAP